MDDIDRMYYKLLGKIIKLAIEDYNCEDKYSRHFKSAEKFLFENENRMHKGNYINYLEIYLSSTDLSAGAIRKNIRRR